MSSEKYYNSQHKNILLASIKGAFYIWLEALNIKHRLETAKKNILLFALQWYRMPSHSSGSHSPKYAISLQLGLGDSRSTALYHLSCSLEHYNLTEGDSRPIHQGYNLPFLKELFLHSKRDLDLIFHLKDRTPISNRLNLTSVEYRLAMNFQGLH